MPTLGSFTRSLDDLMARWPGVGDNRDQAPLEGPARVLFGTRSPEAGELERAIRDVQASGPHLAAVLRVHPSLSAKDPSRTLGALFDEGDLEWAGARGPFGFTGLMVSTIIALSDAAMPEQVPDLAIRIGFGLDPFNGLLRERLFGRFGKLQDPLKLGFSLPRRLNRFDDLLNRTCLFAMRDALANVAAASAAAPKVSPAVIRDIRPDQGCDGTVVEIRGHGFGAVQPADLDLCFTAYGGGLLTTAVRPSDWADTLIRAAAPNGVGNGPVSLIRRGNPNYSGDTLPSATEQLAGVFEGCFGMGGSGIAFKLRQLAAKLGAPLISTTDANHFWGGAPRIIAFTGNHATQVLLRPRGPLVIEWATDNADKVEIATAGPRELPVVADPLPLSGEVRYPSVNGTSAWQGSYTLTATNACGTVQASLGIEMDERIALALAGGGSKAVFEVGAVRCLTDAFGFAPDIITGTSFGAINAAKLAEGPGALADLEALWLAMQGTADLYQPTLIVTRLVQDLAALGLTGIGAINFAAVLGVSDSEWNPLTPDQQVAVAGVKNIVGTVGGTPFTIANILLTGLGAGLRIGHVITGFQKLIRAPSLFKFAPVRTKIDAAIDPAKVSSSGIKLRIAMVSLDSGQTRYVDERGRFVDDDYPVALRDAVQASASVPIAYPPTVLDEGLTDPVTGPVAGAKGNFIDGGVRDNAPLRAADEAGASSIVAILAAPPGMGRVDFTGAPFPRIAGRAFEALFDESLQNDLAPFGGYNVPVTVIAPQIEPYRMFTVDPGLIRIQMDYGYIRAFDEMQADDALRPQFRKLSLDIVEKRLEIWGPLEHGSEGFLMDHEKFSGGQKVALTRSPSTEYLRLVRTAKDETRALYLARQNLAKTAAANPAGIERAWQKWEAHSWGPTLVDPWRASYAHHGVPVPAGTAPPALPPP